MAIAGLNPDRSGALFTWLPPQAVLTRARAEGRRGHCLSRKVAAITPRSRYAGLGRTTLARRRTVGAAGPGLRVRQAARLRDGAASRPERPKGR